MMNIQMWVVLSWIFNVKVKMSVSVGIQQQTCFSYLRLLSCAVPFSIHQNVWPLENFWGQDHKPTWHQRASFDYLLACLCLFCLLCYLRRFFGIGTNPWGKRANIGQWPLCFRDMFLLFVPGRLLGICPIMMNLGVFLSSALLFFLEIFCWLWLCMSWILGFDRVIFDFQDEMLSDVTGILAGQEHLCLGVNMQRQAMHSLASKLRHMTEIVRDHP